MNDTQFFEASRVFAQRIFSESQNDLDQQIKYGFRLATSRFPKKSEISLIKELYQNQLDYYRKNKSEAYKILNIGNSKKIKTRKSVDKIAAMTMVANTLLNLNESYYKYLLMNCNHNHDNSNYSRRDFLTKTSLGLGGLSLASFLNSENLFASNKFILINSDLICHISFQKLKRVIYLSKWSPSQLDLFDHKPLLSKMNGEELPESVLVDKD